MKFYDWFDPDKSQLIIRIPVNDIEECPEIINKIREALLTLEVKEN